MSPYKDQIVVAHISIFPLSVYIRNFCESQVGADLVKSCLDWSVCNWSSHQQLQTLYQYQL